MVAHTKPQPSKKAKSEKLRGAGYHFKVIDLKFERWQVLGFRKGRREIAYITGFPRLNDKQCHLRHRDDATNQAISLRWPFPSLLFIRSSFLLAGCSEYSHLICNFCFQSGCSEYFHLICNFCFHSFQVADFRLFAHILVASHYFAWRRCLVGVSSVSRRCLAIFVGCPVNCRFSSLTYVSLNLSLSLPPFAVCASSLPERFAEVRNTTAFSQYICLMRNLTCVQN